MIVNPRTRARSAILAGAACLLAGLAVGGVLLAARRDALIETTATSYTPLTGEAVWEGDWEFSELGADPSEAGGERVTILFTGTGLALRVRRGDYRGFLFVDVDGEPAGELPREERGAYLVLTSPDYAPQVVAIPVAAGLEDGPHVATVTADRGWDQWPLAGWSVVRAPDVAAYDWALAGAAAIALAGLAALLLTCRRSPGCRALPRRLWRRCAGAAGPLLARRDALVTALAGSPAARLLRLPDVPAVVLALAAAAAFQISPWPPLTLAAVVALAALALLRLDVGLALVAAAAPFYLHPAPLFGKVFSLVEVATLLCLLAWGVRGLAAWGRSIQPPAASTANRRRRAGLDLAAACFLLAAVASTLVARHRHVALRELRVLFVEPALFYLVLRTSRLDASAVRRIVDCWVAGAVVVALVGLVQYALGVDVITAEEGFRRLRSVYGSPNSVGLYLGRVLPVLVAVALFGASRGRRAACALAAALLGLAVLLSFSKGALILGVPLSLLALGVLAGGRWLWISAGTVAAGIVAAVPLLRTPRFRSLLDTSSGTTFFRLHLWRASWKMFCEHPLLGVGPDNFLYHYRSRTILPAAWQEPDISQAHNVLLDYATRMGVVGLAVGVWLQVAFWRVAFGLRRLADPDRRALALGLMASMVDFCAHGLVDASYFLVDLAFAFFLTLGVVQWLSGRGDAPLQ